ncbi:MAG: endonuclease Q family protein [Candidatus Bilamarchaeaceae archaeon]
MRVIADLHLHSKYSRATSPRCDLDGLSEWARIKGISLLGTGDFTHPKWLREIKEGLKPAGEGAFSHNGVNFLLSAEVSNVFEAGGRTKKIHTLLLAPSFEAVGQLNDILKRYGNLAEDGRPTLLMDVAELLDVCKEVSREIFFAPAHSWTPWFGIFGSKSGFNSLEEAFGKKATYVKALETGLSSDPEMNWMVSRLDSISLISNSDAHSPEKIGREANVFELEEIAYKSVIEAITTRKGFIKTYEFYPEEGKYHWDGHRNCGVCLDPKDAKKLGGRCPKCGKPVTIGVLHRVMDLGDRPLGYVPERSVPFTRLVPLETIISAVRGRGEQAKEVREEYLRLVGYFGNEFAVLEAPKEQLRLAADKLLADAIVNAREGRICWRPGYDGNFGELLLDRKSAPPSFFHGQKRLADF